MTEKRFRHMRNKLGMQFICYDNKEELVGTFADAQGIHNIVEVLNQLSEENEQLKSRVDYLKRKIQRERASAMKQHEKWEKELKSK